MLAFAAIFATILLGCPAKQIQPSEPIVAIAVVDAPVEQVWRAFTTREGAESWMVAHADVDLRVGGKMRTHYSKDGKLGDPGTIENTIICYDPQRMISIKNTRAPESFPFKKAIQEMWTVIYFEPVESGKTKVTCRGLGFTDDPESQQMRKFFERGNQITMDALVARFKGKQ